MIALILLGVILLGGIVIIVLISTDNDRRIVLSEIFFLLGVLLIFFGSGAYAEKTTYEKALDNNPYKKEYIYKQIDNTYVIIDSVYVKKEEG